MSSAINSLNISINQLADATVLSGRRIAQALIYQSSIISTSIQKLTDEIERKNKLDEFYMLLDKIERYEDILIEIGVIREAYNNLRMIVYPTFELDNRLIYLLSKFKGRMLKRVMQLSLIMRRNPIIVLIDLLTNMDYYVVTGGDRNLLILTYSSTNTVNEEDTFMMNSELWYYNDETRRFYFKFNTKNMFIGDYHYDVERSIFLELYIKLHTGDYLRCRKLKTENPENIGTLIVENLYNDIVSTGNEREMNLCYQGAFSEIKEQIDRANQEIQMENLRSLYINLRECVKDYKIKRSISD